MKKTITIILNLLLFASCVKKADIKLPAAEKKPVLTCFISPQDSIITAVVAWSTPKLGLNGSSSTITAGAVRDASLYISSGTAMRTFSLNPDFLYYECSGMRIEEGQSYTLSLSMPGGKHLQAATTVPRKVSRLKTLSSHVTRSEPKKIEAEVEVVLEDFQNETNYFAVFTRQMSVPFRPGDPFGTMGSFDTDEKLSRQEYHLGTGASFYSSSDTITGAWLYLDVLHCNREFYLYNKSVQEAGIASLNPFADPAMVYTNIPGGFGCFGAYVKLEKKIELR